METKLIAFSFCWLMVVGISTSHLRPLMDLEEDMYDSSAVEADNFFRLLLLSKYGLDSSEYPAVVDQILSDEESEELPMSFDVDENPMSFDVNENPMSFDGDEKPINFKVNENPMSFDDEETPMYFDVNGNPMEFDVEEKLLSFNTDDDPEDLSFDDGKLGNPMHPFQQATQELQEEHSTTPSPEKIEVSSIAPSSTTSEPDLLASMPPVIPDKGQKEFVMLRPPSDNNRRIERIMEEMAKDLGIEGPLILQKKRFAM